MNDNNLRPLDNFRSKIIVVGYIMICFWLLVLGGLLWGELKSYDESVLNLALTEARASYNKDLVYRRWAAIHGGVYVPVTVDTPPNPYLSHVEERDISTPSGRKLTLVNPAYMTRQVHELALKQYGVKGHITSLKPIRPENKADKWEKESLESLENGGAEIHAIETIDGNEYLRLLLPMKIEESCLKCHRYQGYEVGDLRGGISVSVPMLKYRNLENHNTFVEVAIHLSLAILGICGLLFIFHYFTRLDTKRAFAERGLLESEKQLRTVFNAADNVALVITDLGGEDTRVVDFSTGAEKIFGYTSEEINGERVDVLHPPGSSGNFSKMQQSLREGEKGFSGEATLMRKSGEMFPSIFTVNALHNVSGELIGTVGFTVDISERKKFEEALQESEERFRSMMQQAPFVIEHYNIDGLQIEVNLAYEELWGFPGSQTVNKFNVLESKEVEETGLLSFVQRAYAGEIVKVPPYEFNPQGNTEAKGLGRVRWLSTGIYPLKNKNGEVNNIVIIHEDISDIKASEQERKKLELQVQQAQKMESIGNLAGGIAHDFNNILTAIFGYVQLAKMTAEKPEKQKDAIVGISQAAERAKNLVKQILTFSRQTRQEKQHLSISMIGKEVATLLRHTVPTTIEIKYLEESKDTIFADATQIHQVLMNLCTNAYQAMRMTGGILDIKIADQNLDHPKVMNGIIIPPGKYVTISVGDTGAGMDAETIKKIYEPYFTTKEVGEGTGLGLAVVHGIVTDHNGFIVASSATNLGTTFKVYFPTTEKEKDTVIENDLQPSVLTGDQHILFVDDEKPMLDLAQRIFSRYGYTITACVDPTEALKLFLAAPYSYDILVTDMTMPKLTGIELIRDILAVRPGMPVLLCTGYSDSINAQDAESQGVTTFIEKPYRLTALLKIIKNTLNRIEQ